MNKKKIVCVVLLLILILTVLGLYMYYPSDETTPIEENANLSVITEEEVVELIENDYKDIVSDYECYYATYYNDKKWRVIYYNEPIELDGGLTFIVDEISKKVIIDETYKQ